MKNFFDYCKSAAAIAVMIVFVILGLLALFAIFSEPIEGTWADTLWGIVLIKAVGAFVLYLEYLFIKYARSCERN